jgi:DNA-directed RNA polymerase specialized sigma subunit
MSDTGKLNTKMAFLDIYFREEGFKYGVEFSVLKMLKRNIPVNEICEIMGLTHEEVNELKNKMAG